MVNCGTFSQLVHIRTRTILFVLEIGKKFTGAPGDHAGGGVLSDSWTSFKNHCFWKGTSNYMQS